MGNVCAVAPTSQVHNRPVKTRGAVSKKRGRTVAFSTHLLAVAFDYEGYPAEEVSGCGPLSCTPDATRVVDLAKKCGTTDIVYLSDNAGVPGTAGWPTKEAIVQNWNEMVARCKPGDTFVFLFSGHGDQQADKTASAAEEADGTNEELCVCNQDGSYDPIVDDEIADLLAGMPEGIDTLVITDCCHSGSVCDLDTKDLGDRQVVHLAAVKDSQAAQDLGNGGALTSAILEVIKTKVSESSPPLSVPDLYNACLARFGEEFEAEQQSLSIATSARCKAGNFAFPLWPGKGCEWDCETPLGEDYDDDEEQEEEWEESDHEGVGLKVV